MYMYHNFFIHSSVDGHLGCFHVLAIVNSAAMNNGIHVSFSILISSGYMPRSGIAGSYGGFPYCSWGSQGKNTEVVCHSLLQCMKVKSESEVAQSCPALGSNLDVHRQMNG